MAKKDDVSEETKSTQENVSGMDPKLQDIASVNQERESIYEKYDQMSLVQPAVQEKEPEPGPEETAEPEPPAVQEDTGASTEEEEDTVAPADPEEKKTEDKKEKTVPYAALFEERKKRKAAAMESQDYKSEIEKLRHELEELRPPKAKTEKSDYQIEDYETTLKITLAKQEALEETIRKQNEQIQKLMESDQQRLIRNRQEELDRDIQKVDKELSTRKDNPIRGFSKFVPLVSMKINELVAEDRANEVFRQPEGWKYVYEKYVYPDIKGEFLSTQRQVQLAEKEKLKQEAGLVGSPGQVKSEDKEEEVETPKEYLKRRRNQAVQ